MGKKLTIGMRARISTKGMEEHSWPEYAGHDVLLKKRSSGGNFSVMVLGQKELKKKDPKTVINEIAWLSEDELEFVNADFESNLDFMDWYQEHKDEFCGDCLAWFPNNGRLNPDTDEDYVCPNEDCPGRLYDSGHCPHCKTKAENDKCPKCGFEFNL